MLMVDETKTLQNKQNEYIMKIQGKQTNNLCKKLLANKEERENRKYVSEAITLHFVTQTSATHPQRIKSLQMISDNKRK